MHRWIRQRGREKGKRERGEGNKREKKGDVCLSDSHASFVTTLAVLGVKRKREEGGEKKAASPISVNLFSLLSFIPRS